MKRQKLNSTRWLTNVIYLVQEGELKMEDIYAMTNTVPSQQCESLLYEHPSIHVARDVVSWKPFIRVSDQHGLLQHFKESYPRPIRRIELRGLYPFVDVDIDELLFRKKIEIVDKKQDSMIAALELKLLPFELADHLRRAASIRKSQNEDPFALQLSARTAHH